MSRLRTMHLQQSAAPICRVCWRRRGTPHSDGLGTAAWETAHEHYQHHRIRRYGRSDRRPCRQGRTHRRGRSRDAPKARALAEQVGAGATTGTFGAAPAGDIVILAVPYAAVLDVVKQYGEALAGKLLVDITNPVASDHTSFVTP